MNILKLLPITVIALNFNHYSSFAENNSEFIENNSVFEETYSVVWDSKKNQADVKKTTNPIDDFVAKLTAGITGGNLIHQAYLEFLKPSRNIRKPSTPKSSQGLPPFPNNGTPLLLKRNDIQSFKEVLETTIKEYFSSIEYTTYDKTAVKDFVNQLFTITKIMTIDNETVNDLITKVKDPKLSRYISKIFQTEK
ncbi:MAG: hypothetical protein ACLRFH_02045 [Opitutales bacterium]